MPGDPGLGWPATREQSRASGVRGGRRQGPVFRHGPRSLGRQVGTLAGRTGVRGVSVRGQGGRWGGLGEAGDATARDGGWAVPRPTAAAC